MQPFTRLLRVQFMDESGQNVLHRRDVEINVMDFMFIERIQAVTWRFLGLVTAIIAEPRLRSELCAILSTKLDEAGADMVALLGKNSNLTDGAIRGIDPDDAGNDTGGPGSMPRISPI